MTSQMSPLPSRTCSVCTEVIKPDAVVCWHCGLDFRTGNSLRQPTKTNAFAIVSLVLGIVPIFGVGAIVGVIFGHLSLGQIRDSNGTETGRGLAIAGLVLGYMWIALYVILVIVVVVFIIVYEPPMQVNGGIST